MYIDASVPICFTAFNVCRTRIFVSHGFVEDLSDVELRLVAHHELIHVRERHAAWNLFWHVAFAALVLPGFAGVERALRQRRELSANVATAQIDPLAYERLLARRARERRSLCYEGRVERVQPRIATVGAPVAVVSFFIALLLSHADFMHDLPFLAKHHC